jgi:hypothetical protein
MLLTSYGCMSTTPPEPKVEHPAVQTYKSFFNAWTNTIKKALDVLDEYTMMTKDPTLRSFADNNNNITFDKLASYLNSRGGVKLLGLKRMKVMGDGSQAEVSLGEELSNIIKEFQEEIEKIAPDPTPALSLPGVKTNEEGNIVIGDDMVIDRKTLPGAITTEILNAQARGEDVEEVIKSLNSVSEEIEKGGNSSVEITQSKVGIRPQGFYTFSTPKWNNGVIWYKFEENFPQDLRNKVIEGMNRWSSETGVVRFEEKTDWLTDFFTTIGLASKVIVRATNLINSNTNISGSATVGSHGGWQSYIILKYNADMRTVLHELGHVLGLSHEHQRGDRDEYVEVIWEEVPSSVKDQYEKIDLFRIVREDKGWWEYRPRLVTIWIGPFRVVIGIPNWVWVKNIVEKQEPTAFVTGYDYFSIMHYTHPFILKKPILVPLGGIYTDTNVIFNIYTNTNVVVTNYFISLVITNKTRADTNHVDTIFPTEVITNTNYVITNIYTNTNNIKTNYVTNWIITDIIPARTRSGDLDSILGRALGSKYYQKVFANIKPKDIEAIRNLYRR